MKYKHPLSLWLRHKPDVAKSYNQGRNLGVARMGGGSKCPSNVSSTKE